MAVVQQVVLGERDSARHDDRKVRENSDEAIRGASAEHEVVTRVMNERPQGVIDRRADDVRDGHPDHPAAMAEEKGEAHLHDDEGEHPERGGRRRSRQCAQLGMRGEHLPPTLRVGLAVSYVNVVE